MTAWIEDNEERTARHKAEVAALNEEIDRLLAALKLEREKADKVEKLREQVSRLTLALDEALGMVRARRATMSNNSVGGNHTDAGAVAFGGHNNAAPAQFTVGCVGFGPSFDDDEVRLTHAGWKRITDGMAASIVRLEQEAEELRAGAALAEAERIEMARMLRSEREMHAACQNERDELRMRLEAMK